MEQKINRRLGNVLQLLSAFTSHSFESVYYNYPFQGIHFFFFLIGCSTIKMGSSLCALSLHELCWHCYFFFLLCSVLCDVAHERPVIFFFIRGFHLCLARAHCSVCTSLFPITLCICTIIILKNATLFHLSWWWFRSISHKWS